MIDISPALDQEIKAESQHVKSKLVAWMADIRYIDNPATFSSAESYSSLIMDRDPIVYLPMGDYKDVIDTAPTLTKYIYDASGNGINLYPGSSASYPNVLTTTPSRLFYVDAGAYEQLINKRVFSTFSDAIVTPHMPTFTSSGSGVASDPDLEFFSWSTNDTFWDQQSGEALYSAAVNPNAAPLGAFLYVNAAGRDGFVDWKNGGSAVASGGVLRYVDDQNFIIATSNAGAVNAQIIKVVNGTPTTVATVAGGPGVTNYYRFEAKGNTFNLYDLGASEPSNATSGSLMLSAYIDDDVFQTDEANNVGFGSHSLSGSTYNVACEYFAFHIFNYRYKFMNFTGSTFLGPRYAGGLSEATSIARSSFTGLFAIAGSFKTGASSPPYTIIHKSVDISPKIHQWRVAVTSDNKLTFNILDNQTRTYYQVKSVTSISSGTLYTFVVSFDGAKFNIYLNGVFEASTNLIFPALDDDPLYPSEDLYPGSGLTPTNDGYEFQCAQGVYGDAYGQLFVGADNAGTTFGEADTPHYFNGDIGEIAVLDTDLTAWEVKALHRSMVSVGTLPYETTDTLFNSGQLINGAKEETFYWAICDAKNKFGYNIGADGAAAAIGDTISASDNYGWMGRVKSDGSGVLANEFAGLRFDPRPVNKVRISTGYEVGGIKDFTLYYIDEDNVSTSVGGSFTQFQSYVDVTLPDTYQIKELVVQPTSLWNTFDYARIYSIDPIYEVDLSDYVISASIDEIKENLDSTLPIGSTGANALSLLLDNTDLVFNPHGDSIYAPYIMPDTELFFSLLWELPSGEYEEVKMGDSFYVDTWGVEEGSLTVQPQARDYSKYLQEGTVNGYLGQNITAGKAIAALMKKVGFPARKIHYYESHADVISNLRPAIWYKFSDTAEDTALVSQDFLDHMGLTYGDHNSFPLSFGNPSLIPSESLVVTSNTDRPGVTNTLSFEPKYDAGSTYFGDGGIMSIIPKNVTARNCVILAGADFSMNFAFREVKLSYANAQNIILRQRDDFPGTTEGTFRITMEHSPTTGTKSRYLVLSMMDSVSATPNSVRTESNYEFGEVLNVIVTKDGTTYKVWVNGVLEIDETFAGEGDVVNPTAMTIPGGDDFGNSAGNVQMSSFSFFDRVITDAEIDRIITATDIMTVPVFRYLYATDQSYWDAMLEFATADIGMFYFDRNGDFRYDYRDVIHSLAINNDATPVYYLDEDVNIIDGSERVEVQVNKVNVNINSLSSLNTEYASIWQAETGESLCVSTLETSMDANSTVMHITSTDSPLWMTTGLVKVDDEIMTYNGIGGGNLLNLQRGQYGTTPTAHTAGVKAREARYYEVKYTDAPAIAVRYPFLTAEWLYQTAEIDQFYSDHYKSRILVSATESAPADTVVLLEGTNPVTELEYNFRISGVPVKENEGKSDENIEVEARDFAENIRRYRLKEITIDNKFITTKAYASLIAAFILSYYSEPVPLLNLNIHGVPHIQLNDIIEIETYTRLGIENIKYWVIENKIAYDGGIQQSIVLHRYVEPQEATFSVGAPNALSSTSGPVNNINFIQI